jgi:hypothetical protein
MTRKRKPINTTKQQTNQPTTMEPLTVLETTTPESSPDEALAAFKRGSALAASFMRELFRVGNLCLQYKLYESIEEDMQKVEDMVITYKIQLPNLEKKRRFQKDREEAERKEALEKEK